MILPDDVIARARGAFLGVAVGDALGATTEFMTPTEIRNVFGVHRRIVGGGWLHLKPGRVTDDTEMSLALARVLVAHGAWDQRAGADALLAWMRSKPIDIGATVRRGIRHYMLTGEPETPYSDGDAGNGAVMRLAPMALYCFGDDARLERLAVEQARLTHHHPLSDDACVAVGRMVHAALAGADRFALHAQARRLVEAHPAFDFNRYDGQAGGFVVETLRTVFHFLFTTADFEECVVGVVNQGGDADTTGAIAGMIAGAFYGEAAIPPRWLKKLDGAVRQEVAEQAERLVRLSPWGREALA